MDVVSRLLQMCEGTPKPQLLRPKEITAEMPSSSAKEIREAAHNRKYTQLVQNMPEEFCEGEADDDALSRGDRFIVPDPYETYLHNLSPGSRRTLLTVTKDPPLSV